MFVTIRRTSIRRRSGRCCTRSTAVRTRRITTAGTSAGTRRCSPGRATSSPAVNYHGSSGFGQKFLETITGRYGEKEFADIEAGTDYLLRQGYIDRTRLVATGGSYGGYMVAYMNGHTDRYQAYVCHAGCYDWVSMMATDGYRFFAKELGAFHWDDRRA